MNRSYFSTSIIYKNRVGFEEISILLVSNQHPGDCLLGVHPVLWFPNLSPVDCLLGGYRLFIRLLTYFQSSKSVVHSVFKTSESKKEGKDQESIKSGITPDTGYQWESDVTIIHHKREPRGQPFPRR